MTGITLEKLRQQLTHRQPARVLEPFDAQAAVALVVVPSYGGDLELLFIRRAEKLGDPWSGHIALPGGRRNQQDPDLRDTAIRETREETGVELSDHAFLADLDEVRPRTPSLPPIVIRPHLFGLPNRPTLKPSYEVADTRWISLKTLRDSQAETTVEVRGSSLVVPAFLVGPVVIWGLTERIVKGFLDLIDLP